MSIKLKPLVQQLVVGVTRGYFAAMISPGGIQSGEGSSVIYQEKLKERERDRQTERESV